MSEKKFKGHVIAVIVGIILGLIAAYLLRGKPTDSVRIERDTVVQYDTVSWSLPKAKDSVLVKWATIKVPFERIVYVNHPPNDSLRIDTIEAELPVTQKHYQTENYQAWVSGVYPNLDSIEVYQKTQTITETITITQYGRQKRWGLGFSGGCNYLINEKKADPYAGLELNYNGDKWGASVSGGYMHDTETRTGAPYVNATLSYKIITF